MDEEKEPTSSSVVSVEAWKRELLNLAASYDRGFGATATAREKVAALVQYLETANNPKQQQQQQQEFPTIATTLSTSKERTAGPMLSDNNETSASKTNTAASSVLPDFPSPTFSPLVGQWRMIWTTALDVLSLQASPFFTTGAIHQVYTAATSSSSSSVRQRVENSKVSRTAIPVSRVTNMIDFTPRVQALFPVSSSNSLRTLIRATVETRACRPYSYKNDSNSNAKTDDEDEDSATGTGSNARQGPLRIGLIFDSVSVQPIQLFGLDTNGILPPFGFDLPKIPQSLLQQFNNINDQTSADIGSNTANEERSPGYFDVTFLDDDFLVIRQNAPGGIFVLVRVDSIEP